MEVRTRYDLAVIGGGPAGTSAAYAAARRGLRVALLERGAFPRDKVCGEFISHEALPQLEQMAPELVAAAPRIETAIFIASGGAHAAFRLPQPARGISRLALDAALWEAAGAAGATLMPRTAVTGIATIEDGFELQGNSGFRVAARQVTVAAGRWWRIAGIEAQAEKPGPWVGIKARFRGLERHAAVEMYAFHGGYCGLAPVENRWVNACCLVHRRRAGELGATRDFAAWIGAVSGSQPLIKRLRGGEQVTATVVTAPVGMGSRTAMCAGVLMAGDAAGFIDPFTGDGLARALLSGALAGAMAASRDSDYAKALRRAVRPGFRTSAGLRLLVGGPGWLQSLALRALARPGLGSRLVTATRWSSPSN